MASFFSMFGWYIVSRGAWSYGYLNLMGDELVYPSS